MEPWQVAVNESVRETIARYTWAGDAGRVEDVGECFTTGGVLDVGPHGGRWSGREEIVRRLGEVVERLAAGDPDQTPGPVRHHVSGTLITEATLSSASARSYFLVMTGDGPDHWGRYYDLLRPQGGRWRFEERIVRVDGAAAGSRFLEG